MKKRLIIHSQLLEIMVNRLCQQLIEDHTDFKDSIILGLQPRGVFLAERITKELHRQTTIPVPLGYLDATFFRDDFRMHDKPLIANENRIPFSLENKKVILVDDVLYTGRTVRSALEAMISYGRPQTVELLVLIDRKYERHMPIQPKYVGKEVNTITSQKVWVELKEQQGIEEDNIWLITKEKK